VIEKLGEGGMGEVWRVRHAGFTRDRALKLIHTRFALNAETRERMLREAQAMDQISHAHAVTVHDVGTDPVPYIEMEFVQGKTLNKAVPPDTPMPLDWTARILEQLCDVLQVAHDHGIVHRDLKPSNLMLLDGCPPGKEFLKVLDFGIAKFLHSDVENITVLGSTLGTLSYMSPEQVLNSAEVDARADIYTIGTILYELLTGCRPFTSRVPQIYNDIIHTPAPRFHERNPHVQVPRGVEDLVLRCLEKEPKNRPSSARALAEDFRRLALPPPPAVRAVEVLPAESRSRRRLFAAVGLSLLGLGGYALYRELQPEAFTLKAAQPQMRTTAGLPCEVAILVGSDRLASSVRVSLKEVGSSQIRVSEARDRSTSELRQFDVETSLDATPGTYTLEFEAFDGRSHRRATVELAVDGPPLAPLPEHWTRARDGAELVWVGKRVYPRAIEREVASGVRVVALLIDQADGVVAKPYYIMRDKVWQGLFEVFAHEHPAQVSSRRWQLGGDARLPVRNVTAPEAQAFAEWLGGEGRGFLPSTDQWDQAAGRYLKNARPGPFLPATGPAELDRMAQEVEAFGDEIVPGIAVGRDECLPLPVGLATRDISPFGCRDMSGNGREWTRPQPGPAGQFIPLRAASFCNAPAFRFEHTDPNSPASGSQFRDQPDDEIGFRVVIELEP
jgi:formylglycine-generating enzyme required for sulfatase activity/tRNA A-37 threonylcarbamoyl transferase component Bud32